MTSKLTGRPVISGFTISVLRASGWYKVSSDIEETLEWGNGKGCSFLNDQCFDFFDEFCQNTDQMNCTVDFSGEYHQARQYATATSIQISATSMHF